MFAHLPAYRSPTPVWEKPALCYVRVTKAYTPNLGDEMDLVVGETVKVVQKEPDNGAWWFGVGEHSLGWFPSWHAEVIEAEDETAEINDDDTNAKDGDQNTNDGHSDANSSTP